MLDLSVVGLFILHFGFGFCLFMFSFKKIGILDFLIFLFWSKSSGTEVPRGLDLSPGGLD